MGQAAKISGRCQGNINIGSPDGVFPAFTWRESVFPACLCSHLLIKSLDYFEAMIAKQRGGNSPQAKQADVNVEKNRLQH